MVSLVLVAHSDRLLGALVELIASTNATPPPCSTAGGTDDGRMGTSLARIRTALRAGLEAAEEGCLILYDTGSAWLTIEFALDELPPNERSRVVLSNGPLVEGGLAAAARAADGAPLADVAEAAASALEREKRPKEEPGADVRLTA